MSVNLHNMVESAQSQARRVEESSSSAEELASSTDRIAQGAGRLLELCDRSRQETANGMAAMDATENGLHRIESVNLVTTENGKLLEQKTGVIGRISAAIEKLPDHTTHLPPNATIEAARAGEHGAGFAVIADELTK